MVPLVIGAAVAGSVLWEQVNDSLPEWLGGDPAPDPVDSLYPSTRLGAQALYVGAAVVAAVAVSLYLSRSRR